MREFLNGVYTLGELEPKERLDALYEFLHALPDETTRRDVYRLFPNMSKYTIDQVLRIFDFSNILYVWRGVIRKEALAKRIEARGRLTLEDFSKAPKWVIKTLTRKPVRREVYIGDDTSTGYDVYYNYSRKMYVLRDANKKLIKMFSHLGLILTFSLSTDGHERLVCEMASWTWVTKTHPKNFGLVEDTLAKFMTSVLKVYFGFQVSDVAIKGGLEYMSETGSYISEETSAEFTVDFIEWDDAKCVIEYVHERKIIVHETLHYKPVRKGKISIRLKEFEKKYPEMMQKLRGKEIQHILTMHLKVRK